MYTEMMRGGGDEVYLIKKARDHWMKHKKATT